MKLLVVTPTLGHSIWLQETVASVAVFTDRHVLVAPSVQVPTLAERFPRVKVIPEPGGGMYAAINAGLRLRGDWDAFTYLNDDDLLLAAFADLLKAMAGREHRPLVGYGRVRLIDAAGRRLGAIPISPAPRLNRRLYAQGIEPVYQHGTIVSRPAFDRIGEFDVAYQYSGDSDYLARACLSDVPFVCTPHSEVAAFRLRSGQLTKSRAKIMAERRQVDAKLKLRDGGLGFSHQTARWWFRMANIAVYLERVRRFGLVSFDEVLTRTGGGDQQ